MRAIQAQCEWENNIKEGWRRLARRPSLGSYVGYALLELSPFLSLSLSSFYFLSLIVESEPFFFNGQKREEKDAKKYRIELRNTDGKKIFKVMIHLARICIYIGL